jgi:hypothetical protein
MNRAIEAFTVPDLPSEWKDMLIRSTLCALTFVVLGMAAQDAAAQVCKPSEATTEFGTWINPNIELNATNNSVEFPIDAGGLNVESVRFLFRVMAAGQNNEPWSLVIRDRDYRALAALTQKDFANEQGAVTGTRWTGRLPGAVFRVELTAGSVAHGVRLLISDGVALPSNAGGNVQLFSVQNPGNPAWINLYSSRSVTAKRSGDAVGMIYSGKDLVSAGVRKSWCCSGVLVAADLMMTNWHCGGVPDFGEFWDPVTCGNTLVDFSWDGGKTTRQFGCVEVVAKSEALDYAVLRLRPVVGEGGRTEGFTYPKIRSAPIKAGADLYTVHHANCSPKLLSTNCSVGSVDFRSWIANSATAVADGIPANTEITHTCDTEPGASGAPVFDLDGRLIALHHLGFARDRQCRQLDSVNKAIEIRHVLDHLKNRFPGVYREVQDRIDTSPSTR